MYNLRAIKYLVQQCAYMNKHIVCQDGYVEYSEILVPKGRLLQITNLSN